MKPLPEALRDLMAERQVTACELWAAADLSPAVLYRYLSGERGRKMNPQAVRTVEKLAAALGVEPEYFVEYRQQKVKKAVEEALAQGLIDPEDLELMLERKKAERARGSH